MLRKLWKINLRKSPEDLGILKLCTYDELRKILVLKIGPQCSSATSISQAPASVNPAEQTLKTQSLIYSTYRQQTDV